MTTVNITVKLCPECGMEFDKNLDVALHYINEHDYIDYVIDSHEIGSFKIELHDGTTITEESAETKSKKLFQLQKLDVNMLVYEKEEKEIVEKETINDEVVINEIVDNNETAKSCEEPSSEEMEYYSVMDIDGIRFFEFTSYEALTDQQEKTDVVNIESPSSSSVVVKPSHSTVPEVNLTVPVKEKRKDAKYTCLLCESAKTYRSFVTVIGHENEQHPGIKKYACPRCVRKFCSLESLDLHIKTYHKFDLDAIESDFRWNCVNCDKNGDSYGSYKEHAEREYFKSRCQKYREKFNKKFRK